MDRVQRVYTNQKELHPHRNECAGGIITNKFDFLEWTSEGGRANTDTLFQNIAPVYYDLEDIKNQKVRRGLQAAIDKMRRKQALKAKGEKRR